jgi:hypothetical protein
MSIFYDKVYSLLESYLNDSVITQRFLDRQIKYHLSKTPETLNTHDKETLAKWCRISSSLILKEDQAEELHQKILALD